MISGSREMSFDWLMIHKVSSKCFRHWCVVKSFCWGWWWDDTDDGDVSCRLDDVAMSCYFHLCPWFGDPKLPTRQINWYHFARTISISMFSGCLIYGQAHVPHYYEPQSWGSMMLGNHAYWVLGDGKVQLRTADVWCSGQLQKHKVNCW